MSTIKQFTIASSLLVLTACGGSGGGATSSPTTPSNPPPQVPIKNILFGKIVETDRCGKPYEPLDAFVIIHNDDFSTKEFITADASGAFSYETENDKETITIGLKERPDAEGHRELSLRTFVDQPVKDIGNIEFINVILEADIYFDDVLIDGPLVESAYFRVHGVDAAFTKSSDSGFAAVRARICKTDEGLLSPYSATVTYADSLMTEPSALYGQYVSEGSNYAFADIQGVKVNVTSNSPAPYFRADTFVDGKSHFESADGPFVFPYANADFYRVMAFGPQDEAYQDPETGASVSSSSILRKTFTNTDEVVELNFLVNPIPNLKDFIRGNGGSYDFEAVAAQADYFIVTTYLKDLYLDVFWLDWNFTGPLKGSFPTLSQLGINDFLDLDNLDQSTGVSAHRFSLAGNESAQGYSDYLEQRIDDKAQSWFDSYQSNVTIVSPGNYVEFPALPEGSNLTAIGLPAPASNHQSKLDARLNK